MVEPEAFQGGGLRFPPLGRGEGFPLVNCTTHLIGQALEIGEHVLGRACRIRNSPSCVDLRQAFVLRIYRRGDLFDERLNFRFHQPSAFMAQQKVMTLA